MKRPRRNKINAESLKIIGVPKKFNDKTIDDFETYGEEDLEKIKSFFADYIKNVDKAFEQNKGLYLYGSNGVGKTMLTSLIAKECYMKRYSVRRITMLEYINKYTEMWSLKDSDLRESAEDHFVLNYKGVEFLIIEEIGKENESKINVNILEDLLRYREDNSLVTIICTNLTVNALKRKYSESIYSLISGNAVPIKFNVKDRRNEKFKESIL